MNIKFIVGAVALALATSSAFAATGASCKSTGSVSVAATIKITSGTYDGGCKTFNGTSALGDGSQNEAQKAYFRISGGATLKNVIIGNNGADGIHSWGPGTLDNITWTNVGEDAFSIKKDGSVTIKNVTAKNAEDKFIQQNFLGTITVTNAIVNGAAKFYRQNGGKTFVTNISVTNSDISNLKEGVFRTDSPNATAKITNSRLHAVPTICIGYAAGKCTSSGLTYY